MTPTRVILDLTYADRQDGTGRYLSSIARELSIHPDIHLIPARAPRIDKLPHPIRLPINGLLYLIWTQLIFPLLAVRHRADLIHAHIIAPYFAPVPTIVTIHDTLDAYPQWRPSRAWSTAVQHIGIPAARRADLVITGSHSAADDLARIYGLTATVIPNATNLNPDTMRQPLGIKFSTPFALIVAPNDARKDLPTAIAAVARVRQSHPLNLVLVGRGTRQFAMHHHWIITAERLPDPELTWLYRNARLLIAPSRYEGFGLPLLEAIQLGTPVVASDIPAHREIATQHPAIRLATPGKPLQFARAITQTFATPKPNPTPGRTWQDVTNQIVDQYKLQHHLPRRDAQLARLNAQTSQPPHESPTPDCHPDDPCRDAPLARLDAQALNSSPHETTAPAILILHPSDERYGADRMLIETVLALRDHANITVALPTSRTDLNHPGPLSTHLHNLGVTTIRVNLPILERAQLHPRAIPTLIQRTITSSRHLDRIINDCNPDLIWTNTLAIPVGPLLARRHRIPHIWHIHEHLGDEPAPIRTLYALLLTLTPGPLITPSRSVARALPSSNLAPRTRVIPNTIDLERFIPPTPPSRPPITIGVIGRLSPRKGILEAIEAVAQLHATGHAPKLRIIGGPPPTDPHAIERYQRLSHALNVGDHVEFLGEVPDTLPHLHQLDILLVPSQRPEPFGLTILEGMAAGLPIVVTRNGGGSDELIQHRLTGLASGPSPGEIATSLATLIDNPKLRTNLGQAAHRAAQNYSRASYQSAIQRLFQTTLATSDRARSS